MISNSRKYRTGGYTLIEVLIGIMIFALGMMALAKLQGNLARNSSDSNARTVATNIAEEFIESRRAFVQIPSDGVNSAYEDIADGTESETRMGNVFEVVSEVTDYYYDFASASFTTTEPPDVARSDFKQLTVTVTWNDSQEFEIDESTQTEGRLGSGSITLTDVISSITSPSSGKAALSGLGGASSGPPVDYNPGENPDIISIQLGENKFKESTTPLPDIIRKDELVETRFDVVTYSQDDAGATFLRREEFRAVSCECTLRIPDTGEQGGLRPTIWEGYEYTEAEYVTKPYGEAKSSIQSQFCGLCCRDHHDGGTGENDVGSDPGRSRYNPFRAADEYHIDGYLSGDHKHYKRDSFGNLILAESDGDSYVEACRMVRKDGFFRIAQDLRQEGLNSFPADFMDEEGEVGIYSDYVTDAVIDYEASIGATDLYEGLPPDLTLPELMPTPIVFPASTIENATELPTPAGATEQQLRARGIYIDYMSDVLRTRINCLDAGGTGEECEVPEVASALEIIPFYDVQLTWLSRWNESPNNNPVDVSNEAIANDNLHDRGNAVLGSGFGLSTVNSAVHRGNLGLTGTDPIDLAFASDVEKYNLFALAVDFSAPPPLSGIIVTGSITSAVPGVKAADVEIEATEAACDRTLTGFECVIEEGAKSPNLKVSNYYKFGKSLVACSEMAVHGTYHDGTKPGLNWTLFRLPSDASTTVSIVIKEDSC